MKKLIFLVLILLNSCSAPFILMANLKTGETVQCSAVGVGLIRSIAASHQVENCVAQYQGLGYVRADQLTEDQRRTLGFHPPGQQQTTVLDPPRTYSAPSSSKPTHCTTVAQSNVASTNCY